MPLPLYVRYRILLILAIGILLYVPWLGGRDLWYPDEPDLAEVSRAMYLSGDWIAPRHHGKIWVDYPPMLYWAGSISSHLMGGMSEFTLRFPSALSAICLLLGTCVTGSLWFGPGAGWWAGIVLLTSWRFSWQSIGFRPDMLFSLFIGLGLLMYARGAGERPQWGPRIAGFALLGLAVLTKGPLGLLLPGLVLTLWHGMRREWRRLFELVPLTLVALAVALPWYIACARAMGTGDLLQAIYTQNFARFQSGIRGHGRPPYYYLINVFTDLAPWSVLLPLGVLWIVRTKQWQNRHVQLALWWFGTFFAFLSIAATKRQLYLLPAYPAAVLLLSSWLSRAGLSEGSPETPNPRPAHAFVASWSMGLIIISVIAFGAAAAMASIVAKIDLHGLYREIALNLRAPILALGVTSLIAGFWIQAAWRRGEIPIALFRSAMGNVLLLLVLMVWVIPAFSPIKTYVPQTRWIRDQIGPETRIGLVNLRYGNLKRGAFAYYTGVPVDLLETRDDLERFFQEHPRSLVLVHKGVADEFFTGDRASWRAHVMHEFMAGGYSYLVLRGSAPIIKKGINP